MENLVLQLGVGGIFAVLVIKIVLDYLIKNKNNNSKEDKLTIRIDKIFNNMSKTIEKMHDLLNRYDSDGKPVWYFPQSVLETDKKLLEVCQQMLNTIIETCKLAETTNNKIDKAHSDHNEFKKDVDGIKKDIEYIKKDIEYIKKK